MRVLRLLLSVRFWFAADLLLLIGLLAFHFSTDVAKPRWWPDVFGLTTNLLAGGLVSFLFYYLVVHYPEQRKKHIIKTNLSRMYRNIKSDILWQVVFASIKGRRHDLSTDLQSVERLMDAKEFKACFKDGREGDEGFYAFQNQMSDDTPEFRAIVLSLQMLSKQIEFVLHNYDIADQRAFDFFKRLELMLLRLQYSEPGYDDSKALCGFIWEIYAGWDWIHGDRGYDIIEKMIADI